MVLGAARREADAAVAHQGGGDPVRRRRRHPFGPDGLPVVVGVEVDESGGDKQSGRLDLPGAFALDGADRDDDAVGHGDVAPVCLTTQTVDDGAIADDQVVAHGTRLRRGRLPRWSL